MADNQIDDDWVMSVPIVTQNSAGAVVAAPAGDTYTVTSSLPASLQAAIGTMADGTTPAVILTPMVQASTGITITVTDSAGLASSVSLWDIVQDVQATQLALDVSDATHVAQPVPTNPGP